MRVGTNGILPELLGEDNQHKGLRAMKSIIALSCVITVMAISGSADARGCVKGAVVGGAAGHYAGHGLLGAAAGCLIGRHEASKHEIEQERVRKQGDYQNVGPEYH
jgi:hypothetical protein